MKLIWSIPICRILGIRVELHSTFVFILVLAATLGGLEEGLIGLFSAVGMVLLIFGCVLLHELGHCAAAMRYGIRTHRILMMPIGGMAQFDRMPRNPIKEIVITAAGPAVNFAIALVLLPWVNWPIQNHWNTDLVTYLFGFNLLMGTFNLLPIYPMDGGRLLRAAIATQLTYARSTHWALMVAKPLAVVGMLVGFFWLQNPLLLVLFAFILISGEIEFTHIKQHELMRGLFVRDVTQRLCVVLESTALLPEAVELLAQHGEQPILITRPDGSLRGVLSVEAVREAQAAGRHAEPLANLPLSRPHVLQEDWPLEAFGKIILKSEEPLIPVYNVERLSGAIDTRIFRDFIYQDILEERLHPTFPGDQQQRQP